MSTENLIVYGAANCTWYDNIERVGQLRITGDHLLPCCPMCQSPLLQVSEEEWNKQVQDHADRTADPEYKDFVEWMRGRCFTKYVVARSVYRARAEYPDDIGKNTCPVEIRQHGRGGRFA